MSVAIVSGADSGFFEFLAELILSVREQPEGRGIPFCIFDMGFTEQQREWLQVHGATLRQPVWQYNIQLSLTDQLLVNRSRTPEYFPGHELYLWIDADAWVQCWDAVDIFVAGARDYGFAVAPERHPNYNLSNYWGIDLARQWFGPPAPGTREIPINAGVFCGRADAPHWKAWHDRVASVVERPPFSSVAHFALDQAALNVILDRDRYPCAYPSERNNFLCNHGTPKVSEDASLLLDPYPPYQPLGIVHNAGKEKTRFASLQTPTGKRLTRGLKYLSRSTLPVGDYVSPGFTPVMMDRCFPDMVKGNPTVVQWPYLRQGINHNWYVDKRDPTTGFINRDEAHILYNNALRFTGAQALEIGCHMGWSACHLAMAGVNLDVLDPALNNPQIQESVLASLQNSNPAANVRLYPERSPEGVERIASEQNRKWSLFFIDGDHAHPGPLNDTIVCEKYAEADAMILFHDLMAPDVAQGLVYLRDLGWKTRIYHTAQIMGVAWRGAVDPVHHMPDPAVTWTIPEHLRGCL